MSDLAEFNKARSTSNAFSESVTHESQESIDIGSTEHTDEEPPRQNALMRWLSTPAPHRPTWQRILFPFFGFLLFASGILGIIIPFFPSVLFITLSIPLMCTFRQTAEAAARRRILNIINRVIAWRKARRDSNPNPIVRPRMNSFEMASEWIIEHTDVTHNEDSDTVGILSKQAEK